MNPKLVEPSVAAWTRPYDNTALRERIGNAEIVTRSVIAELLSAARAADTTDVQTRGRWTRKRGGR